MKGASGGEPFRPRVPRPEAPATGSRPRGGGNTDGDVLVSVEPALEPAVHEAGVRNNLTEPKRRGYVSISTGTVRI